MTKTENYSLPQWESGDPIRREDFNDAMKEIDDGISTASAEKFVIGSYVGNGVTMANGGQFIELGFKPRFLIITRGWAGTTRPSDYFLVIGELVLPTMENYFSVQDTGFTVGDISSGGPIKLNISEYTYDYLAFH